MKEPCGDPNRLLIRTASNAYFPQTMSVISLPDKNEAIAAGCQPGLGTLPRNTSRTSTI